MIDDPIISKSIDLEEHNPQILLSNAFNMSQSRFIKQYEYLLRADSPLSVTSLYKKLREYIVDNKIAIK